MKVLFYINNLLMNEKNIYYVIINYLSRIFLRFSNLDFS